MLSDFNWLLGTWKLSDRQETYETWVRAGETVFDGRGYSIRNGTEKTNESIQLMESDGELFYVATVDHNPGPVAFKLISSDGMMAVFENFEHDFPQRIRYERKSDTSLLVEIENIEGTKRQVFHFERLA